MSAPRWPVSPSAAGGTRGRTGLHPLSLMLGLLALAGGLLVLGLGVGSTGLSPLAELLNDPLAAQIVLDIRLPRTLGALSAGALLGLAGAVAQGLFRNPLADPYLLGSASGASLGVATALVLFGLKPAAMLLSPDWLMRLGLTGAAFVGAVLAVALTLLLARGVQQTLRLLLAGVIVGVVLGAMTSLLLLRVPDIMQPMQAFMLGNTGFVGWTSAVLMGAVWALCAVAALAASRVLDGLSLGEATALSLGLPLGTLRVLLVGVLALATGTAVAQTGLIAFVGLAAPHLVRGLVKAGHAWQLGLASLAGGCLLLVADVLARWWMAPQELPVGVLTAVLGGCYLLWLMHRRGGLGGRT